MSRKIAAKMKSVISAAFRENVSPKATSKSSSFSKNKSTSLESATDSLLNLFGEINREGQTILMVTHSVKAASHAGRVLFLRDGVVFHQLYRGGAAEHEFYQRILDAMNALSSPEPQGEFAGMEVSYHA